VLRLQISAGRKSGRDENPTSAAAAVCFSAK